MRRRAFITLLGGAAAWPLAARAQRPPLPVIGFLNAGSPGPIAHLLRIFQQGLAAAGYVEGRNITIEYRWAEGHYDRLPAMAEELVRRQAAVIIATGGTAPSLSAQAATATIPIVFSVPDDPVKIDLVASLARPGRNATGFMLFEYGIAGKWLELLKQIAPGVTRVGVLRDPTVTTGIGQWGAIQTAAPSFGMEASPINLRDAGEIERAVSAFARSSNGGLIATGSALTVVHRDLLVMLAARHRLPTVYLGRHYVAAGGLIAYGPDFLDQYRRAAGYVDRILKGEKPTDLPVQAPTKYELVINLKTAKALGIEVPPTLLARADEMIE